MIARPTIAPIVCALALQPAWLAAQPQAAKSQEADLPVESADPGFFLYQIVNSPAFDTNQQAISLMGKYHV